MHQHISNNKWVIAAIAVVVLLGALAFGAALAGASGSGPSGSGGDESREPVTVIERTVIEKEDDQGVSQGAGQGAAQGDDQADDRDDDQTDDRGEDRQRLGALRVLGPARRVNLPSGDHRGHAAMQAALDEVDHALSGSEVSEHGVDV
jgi:hypothetical protein